MWSCLTLKSLDYSTVLYPYLYFWTWLIPQTFTANSCPKSVEEILITVRHYWEYMDRCTHYLILIVLILTILLYTLTNQSDDICPHQGEWLNVYRNRGSESASFKKCSSKLNPLADVFLPSFIKNEIVEEKVDLTLLDKCSQFCSKHKGELYDDVMFII